MRVKNRQYDTLYKVCRLILFGGFVYYVRCIGLILYLSDFCFSLRLKLVCVCVLVSKCIVVPLYYSNQIYSITVMKKLTPLVFTGLFLTTGIELMAQQRVVQGVVTEADGTPVIGASVVVKGHSTVGVATNIDGKFSINVPNGATTLVVSYIGLKTQEVAITDKPLKIVLQDDTAVITEVVVTGMARVDKRLFTGAATKIASDKSKMDGMADAARALEGKAAGVSVQNVSGTFGSAPKIRVRGATSIFGASKPLWVVDGVVMDDVVDIDASSLASGDATTLISSAIAGLNPDDIESFQVLKDGSATSIYGARAMAGVIVVTTKKGRSGVSKISYTGEYSYRMKPSYSDFNIMNSQQQMSVYLEMEEKGWLNIADVSNAASSGVYGKMWQAVNEGTLLNTTTARRAYLATGELRNTDWFSELFQSNIMHNHSVSMTTGGDKATMYASVSALVDPGWTLQSKVNRYTANINTSYNIHPKLSLNVLANASLRNQRAPGTIAREANPVTGVVSRDFDINPYSYALNSSRTLDPRAYYVRNYAPFNIFHELENNYLKLKVLDLKFQGELKYKPIRGLEVAFLADVKYSGSNTEHTVTEYSNQAEAYRAMGTATIRNNNKYLYTDPTVVYAEPVSVLPQGGFANRFEYSLLGWDTRLSATYSTDFGAEKQHILNAFGGMEVNSLDRYNRTDRVAGIVYDMGGIQFMDPLFYKQLKEQGGELTTIANNYYRNVAFFTNVTYSYKGKYTVNGTLRYEGSNKMGKSTSARWLPTWNTSLAWNVHEESWFKTLSPLSSLTLKASYSLTADKGPSTVTNSSIIVTSTTPWRYPASMQQIALEVASSENSKLTYEKKHELNFGFDAGLFDGRLNLSFDWYKRNNFDLIGPTTTLGVDGQVIKMGNVASMKSSGVELSISSTNVKTKDFRWVTDFVYSYATNKVTKLNAGGDTNVRGLVSGTGFAKEGYSVGSIFSIPFAGLNEEGLPTFYNETGERTVGEIDFQERLNTSWLKYEGTVDPKHFGSLGNTFTYKNWHLNVFLTYAFGNVVRLDPVFAPEYDDLRAMPKEFDNRWVSFGEESKTNVPVIATREQVYRLGSQVPRQDLSIAYSAYNYSTERIAKGDFIRLKEISLSYDFPKEWAKAVFVNSLSLKLQASNLMLLYADKKLNGQDPEFLNSGGVATPLPRQFTMTLRIGI